MARRSTAMISATSDSTAVTTSAVATWSLEITVKSLLRDSASAGNASSASKAIVSLRPCPSFWWRSPAPCRSAARALVPAAPARAAPLAAARPLLAFAAARPLAAFAAFGLAFCLVFVAVAGMLAWIGRSADLRVDGSMWTPIGIRGRSVERNLRVRAGSYAFAQVCASAASMRWSVSSRPSSATLSKMPGDTVVPTIATRSG